MKKQYLLLTLLLWVVAGIHNLQAQSKAIKSTKAPLLKKCHLPADSALSNKVSLAQAQAWADKSPLEVIGTDKKSYSLHEFNISVITMSPMQTMDYGIGNDGVPFLARKALDSLKTGDAIFLKDITAKDAAGAELKIANIVFSIK